MASKPIPSPEVLRQLLRYEPETGNLFWLERSAEHFTDSRYQKSWNTSYAGKRAFTTKGPFGYFQGGIFGRNYKAHRVAWAIHYGHWPKFEIDHINGNTSDNRIQNLRDVPRSINAKNVAAPAKKSRLPAGVYLDKRRPKPFCARIEVNGRPKFLGMFATADEAHIAYKAAVKARGFSDRHGRSAALMHEAGNE